MKVVVDYDRCEANLVCMRIAPEVFEVDDDDNLHILQEQIDDPAVQSKVRDAVARCPRNALRIEE